MATTTALERPPTPTTSFGTVERIAALGAAVAEHGLDNLSELVSELASAGRHLSPAAADVLTAVGEPSVARERALAVVSAALVREHHSARA